MSISFLSVQSCPPVKNIWVSTIPVTCSCNSLSLSPLPLHVQGAQASCYYHYRHCHYPHKFNWRTCRCDSKCSQVYCPRGKVLNPSTCQCECQGRNVRCNQFQEFNSFTCRCECVEVIPAKRRGRDRTDDSSKRRGSDSKRSASDSSDSGCPDGSDSKRSASDSSNGGRCPPKEVTTTRFCPSGQRLNRRTCRCFIRRGFRGRDKTDDSSKGGGSDSSWTTYMTWTKQTHLLHENLLTASYFHTYRCIIKWTLILTESGTNS